MTSNSVTPASSVPEPLSVIAPNNADAVIQALGNLARAQERDMPQPVLDQLRLQVIAAAGPDGVQLTQAA